MRINVTAEDITNGKPGDDCNCPIALAIRRMIPATVLENMTVSVHSNDVTFQSAYVERRLVVMLPAEAESFIDLFDGGFQVEPIIFEINSFGEFVKSVPVF